MPFINDRNPIKGVFLPEFTADKFGFILICEK